MNHIPLGLLCQESLVSILVGVGLILFPIPHKSSRHLPADAPAAILVVMAQDLERPDLRRVADMGPGAGAGVIVPDPNDPERLGSVLGKFTEVHNPCRLLTGHILDSDVKASGDHLIDLGLDFGHLLLCGAGWLLVVAL